MGIFGIAVDAADPFFGTTAADEVILWQAVLMRLGTRRGTLPSSPDYGLLLTDYLLAPLDATALASIPEEVKAELEKDPRFARVVVTATAGTTANGLKTLTLVIAITPSTGPTFERVLSATSAGFVDLILKDT